MRHLVRLLLVLAAAATVLAGCVAPPSGDEAGSGFTSQPYRDIDIVAVSLPGDVSVGTPSPWDFRVHNRGAPGENPFIYSGMCVPPWVFVLRDGAGADLAWSEPMFYCAAYGEATLAGGESRETRWTWNGRLWNAQNEAYEDAPGGSYAVTVTFEGIGEDQGQGPSATHRFAVTA